MIAAALARFDDLHKRLHPETKASGDHGNQYTGGKTTKCRFATPTFAQSAAAITGKSERTIQRYVEAGRKLAPEVVAAAADKPHTFADPERGVGFHAHGLHRLHRRHRFHVTGNARARRILPIPSLEAFRPCV